MELEMKIYIEGDNVYIPFGPDEYLCIGTRDEIEGCSKQRLAEMVLVAKAIYEFKNLDNLGVTKH